MFTKFTSDRDIAENSTLILAPHADDELLGCGGWIIKSIKLRSECRIVIFTGQDDERKKEMQAALSGFEEKRIYHFGLPDFWGRMNVDHSKTEQNLLEIISTMKPSYIFIPSIRDTHPDHIQTTRILGRVLNSYMLLKYFPSICQYEIFVPHSSPDKFLNISNEIDEKLTRIGRYVSQDMKYRLVQIIRDLNSYRGKTFLRKRIQSVETYQLITKKMLIAHGDKA